MSRRIYTKEFKEQAVKLSCMSGKAVAETASDLGLPRHRWRREVTLTGRVSPGRGIARDEVLAELKKRVKRLAEITLSVRIIRTSPARTLGLLA